MTQKIIAEKLFYALVVSVFATFPVIAMDKNKNSKDKDKNPMVLRSEKTPKIKRSRSVNLGNAQVVDQPNLTILKKIVKDDQPKKSVTTVPFDLSDSSNNESFSSVPIQQATSCSNESNNFVGLTPVPNRSGFNPRKLNPVIVVDSKKEASQQKYQAKKLEKEELMQKKLDARIEVLNRSFEAADNFKLTERFPYEITPEKRRKDKSLPPVLRLKKAGVSYPLSSPFGYDSNFINQQSPRKIEPIPFSDLESVNTGFESSEEDRFDNTHTDCGFGNQLTFDEDKKMSFVDDKPHTRKPLTRQDKGSWTPHAKKTLADANSGLTIKLNDGRSGIPQQLARLIDKNEQKKLNNSSKSSSSEEDSKS